MAGEVGHIGSLLEIPDLDVGISCSRAHQQTVGVELGTRQRNASALHMKYINPLDHRII